MTVQRVTCEAIIRNTPHEVLQYIADTRNRTFFLPSLKNLELVSGEPAGSDTKWKWIWSLFGVDFVGEGQSLSYVPGKYYLFETTGGIDSTWNYHVYPSPEGTRLTVLVEYQLPDRPGNLASWNTPAPHQKEVEKVIANLKTVLDK